MFSCLGLCKKSSEEEREPLLPQHRDDTDRQHELRRKLRTYQRLRAVADGYMPSNEQVIANLRSLLASDVLNSQNEDLSDSGRTLVHYVKKWLQQSIALLQHKNGNDQVQDFVWYLSKARVAVDTEDIAERAAKAKSKADVAAGL